MAHLDREKEPASIHAQSFEIRVLAEGLALLMGPTLHSERPVPALGRAPMTAREA